MSTVPSSAELLWRISWLAGTAVPPPPEPAPEPAWLQAPTLAEIDPAAEWETDPAAGRYARHLVATRRHLSATFAVPPAVFGDGNPLEFGGAPPDGREWVHPPYGPIRVTGGHPYLATSRQRSVEPRATPVRKRLGFYEIETSLPVEGTWITTELVQPPLVWGRRWAESKARRILAQHARGEL